MEEGAADATVALSEERALWLATHALPREAALRRWLQGRVAASGMDADDVVQEVYASLAGLPDVAHIRDPWAYMVASARGAILNALRRARIVRIEAFAGLDDPGVADQSAGPERAASAHQQLRETLALIQALPEKCRQAFVLRRVEGLSQRQIAQRMGISENTVEKHVCKGIRLLAEAIGGGPGGTSAQGRKSTQAATKARGHGARS